VTGNQSGAERAAIDMVVRLRQCKVCDERFRECSELKNHVRRKHQRCVTARFKDGRIRRIEREGEREFECICGKTFMLPDSVRRHAKGCSGAMARRAAEGEAIGETVSESDRNSMEEEVNESLNIPFDCIGELDIRKS
jgi:hypothetical protein